MDVLNKLRSTVHSTVSSLSGVLPGNPVTREFEVTNHVCSAGPGLLWKVYQGYKKSTKQEAAIFVFEKKALERWPRESREAILDSLKRGVLQLTRLRHPQVLTVQHQLEESRDSLAFATEPVFASLSNVLGNHDNMPTTPSTQFKDFKLFSVETKYGLLQVSEGLAFLHNDVKLLHNNICPESIVINQEGAWKIFGFDFCIHNEVKADAKPVWQGAEHSSYLPHVCQPSLDYLAPEAGLANTRMPAIDMFALGVVIYAIHNNGAPVLAYHDDYSTYKKTVGELKNLGAAKFSAIPDGLRDIEKMLVNYTADLRPDAHQFRKVDYFEDVGVKTLNYLDSLFQWDKVQKSKFYKGLPPVIQNFPHRICLYRVIPCLGKEFANPTMIPFVLPVVLQIAEKSTREEYMAHIFQYLSSAMKLTEPIQILLIFMQKMELLLKLTPADEVKSDVLPMLYRALDSDSQQIQELCLSVLPTYSSLIDYPSMKNALLPRIKKLAIATPYLSVKVNCLVCIGKLLDSLDKWLVLDEVLPFLPTVPSREPAVLMSILGIYKVSLTHKKLGIPKEVIATKVIPFLMPMCIENGLTLPQFNSLISVLKDMVNRVESEHRTKLEQLNAITQETSALNSSSVSVDMKENSQNVNTDLNSIFSSLDMSTGADSKGGLSMEEKQRIVRQQEASERFGVQSSPIAPTQAPVKTTPKPKDLTSTLLDANLAQMSNSWAKPMQATASPSNALASHSFITSPNTMMTDASKHSFGLPNSQLTPNNSFINNSFSSPALTLQQQPTWQTPIYNPNTTLMKTSPMNNNLGFGQPRFQGALPNTNLGLGLPNYNLSSISQSSQQNSNAKPLSSSEINDLLS